MRIELGPPRYNGPARKTNNEFETGLPFQHSGFRTQVQGLMGIILQDNVRIREFRPDDLAVVAALFRRIFRNGEKCNLATLQSYLGEVFFEHPWRDPELASRVSLSADGMVNGFIGVLPLRMIYRGAEIRAALASSLMVDNPRQDPLAGARLLRSFITGPQDLSLGETSGAQVQRMWQRLGGSTVPTYSMDWERVLRPAQFCVATLKQRSWMAGWLRPVGFAADTLLSASKRRHFRIEPIDARIERSDINANELVALVRQFSARYELKPAWDDASLRWFLTHAARKEPFGDLIGRVVYGKNRTPVGCYLYYGRPGGIALVLQIFSGQEHANLVIKSLLADVNDLGCVAVRGRSQPDLLDALLQNECVFKRAPSVTVHSRNAGLLAAIRAGDALVTGLAGESWARLTHGQFA